MSKFETMPPDELLKLVKSYHKTLGDTEALSSQLIDLGMEPEFVEYVLDIVRSSYARIVFFRMGMKPHQFHGDRENDPLFKAALAEAIAELNFKFEDEQK